MSNQELKIGDVVRLKSGGPKMTVGNWSIKKDNIRCCYWFKEEGEEMIISSFHNDCLEKWAAPAG